MPGWLTGYFSTAHRIFRSFCLENGQYTITQVHSATEFYGYSAKRAQEIKALRQRIEEEFNAKANDSTFNHVLVIPGDAYVIQRDEQLWACVRQVNNRFDLRNIGAWPAEAFLH